LSFYTRQWQKTWPWWVLGPLYTRSPGQCSTQIQHSYWCKIEISPKGFRLGVKAEREKNFSICPKLLINAELYGLVLAPRLKKGYRQIWEANLQPLRPTFQNLLISWHECSSIY
jgi:hypothetical protein